MVGAPLTEFVIEQLIRYGLQDLRDKPSKIDMLFERFLMTSLKTQYGQAMLDNIRQHILASNISVIQNWPLTGEKVPCYSILIGGNGQEIAPWCYFDDNAGEEEELAEPVVLLSFTPSGYDSVTGIITCPSGTDLSQVYVGAVFQDAAGSQFEITGAIIPDIGQEQFGIATGGSVTIGESVVLDTPNWDIAPIKEVTINETLQIGIHAGENTNSCKYLHYLLLYFLESRRLELENLGIHLHSFNISDYHKDIDLLPDNMISRFVTLQVKTKFSWREDVISSLTHSGIGVKVDKDKWVKTGDYTVLTTTEDDE